MKRSGGSFPWRPRPFCSRGTSLGRRRSHRFASRWPGLGYVRQSTGTRRSHEEWGSRIASFCLSMTMPGSAIHWPRRSYVRVSSGARGCNRWRGAARRCCSARPDLVILDVKLPDISGFEVCRRIKSDPATSVIPVLHISTTFVHLEDKIQGLDSGADGYLTNVAEPMELIATVRALLRARRAEETAQLTTRQWQTTFDAISDGVMLLDASGRVVQANRTLEHILGRTWSGDRGQELPALWGPAIRSPRIHRLRGCSSRALARRRTSRSVTCGSTSASTRSSQCLPRD